MIHFSITNLIMATNELSKISFFLQTMNTPRPSSLSKVNGESEVAEILFMALTLLSLWRNKTLSHILG